MNVGHQFWPVYCTADRVEQFTDCKLFLASEDVRFDERRKTDVTAYQEDSLPYGF